jgi:outer membrane protein assembly factor BamB
MEVFSQTDVGGNFTTKIDIMQTIEKYQIETFHDPTFKQNSVDNLHKYDYIYFEESEYSSSTVFGINVYINEKLLKSAVIGADYGATAIGENSIIFETDRILICCSDKIFCLSIPDLELLWQTKADEITCFEIFKYKNSYIVHGELEISRLDNKGKIIWRKSGADIFVTPTIKNQLQLTENYILASDWDNKVYKFGYDGQDYTDMKQFK